MCWSRRPSPSARTVGCALSPGRLRIGAYPSANPSIEGMPNRLRRSVTPHVKRWAILAISEDHLNRIRRIRVLLLAALATTSLNLHGQTSGVPAPQPPIVVDEFRLWSQYLGASQQLALVHNDSTEEPARRIEALLANARQRYGYSRADLDALLAKGRRMNWQKLPDCSVPAQPVRIGPPLIVPPFRRVPPEDPSSGAKRELAIVDAVITHEGKVEQPRVLKAPAGMESRAIATLRSWEWHPALLCGRPIDALYISVVPLYVPQKRP